MLVVQNFVAEQGINHGKVWMLEIAVLLQRTDMLSASHLQTLCRRHHNWPFGKVVSLKELTVLMHLHSVWGCLALPVLCGFRALKNICAVQCMQAQSKPVCIEVDMYSTAPCQQFICLLATCCMIAWHCCCSDHMLFHNSDNSFSAMLLTNCLVHLLLD